MTPAQISAALKRYRVPLAEEVPGALIALALADLITAYLTAKDGSDPEAYRRADIKLRWAVDFALQPDRIEHELARLGSEHEPPPGWGDRVLSKADELDDQRGRGRKQ